MVIEGMNHVLKDAPEDRMGNLQVYSDPENPLADGLIEGLVKFLNDD
jgi:hypothetical protein